MSPPREEKKWWESYIHKTDYNGGMGVFDTEVEDLIKEAVRCDREELVREIEKRIKTSGQVFYPNVAEANGARDALRDILALLKK